MRYWWVNQNQTYRHEIAGGYLWSPKRTRNGRVNPFYEFMKEVTAGDVIFSFSDTRIPAVGRAISGAYEAPKPLEFGQVGAYWELVGWRIDVEFVELERRIRPSEHIDRLRPYLPNRYSPLQPNGNGLQAVYLTELGELLAAQLIDLIGTEARAVVQGWRIGEGTVSRVLVGQAQWEEHQLEELRTSTLSETSKQALALARRGQGLFRARVAAVEKRCRVTGIENLEYLRASHTKPWRDASNEERLDGENGLLLSPDVDHLFDRGLISFEDSGRAIISPVADLVAVEQLGLKEALSRDVGSFSAGQKRYLEYHRENIFLEAKVNRA
ncbi:MAG: HNH endonuclease [Comamonadaceae bacterium]|nr:MAG: HNH endonuclease [Comamonadaceae bacterium]